jgi:cellobiose dehydrogenase (acceptor)
MIWEPTIGTDGFYRQLQWTARVAASLGLSDTTGTAMTVSNYLGLGQWTRSRATIDADLNMSGGSMDINQNAADRAAIVKGLEDMRAALSNVTGLTMLQPPANITSEDYISTTPHEAVNHWLGSCKLGVDDGRAGGQAVVDPDTKVYGMDNLFVVDASIFPGLTTANPSAAIVIAAVKAAERILALGGR